MSDSRGCNDTIEHGQSFTFEFLLRAELTSLLHHKFGRAHKSAINSYFKTRKPFLHFCAPFAYR